MKLLLVLSMLLATALLLSADGSGVTYVDHDTVTAALAKGGPLVTASDLLVSGAIGTKRAKSRSTIGRPT
jgi:hypothetical protein